MRLVLLSSCFTDEDTATENFGVLPTVPLNSHFCVLEALFCSTWQALSTLSVQLQRSTQAQSPLPSLLMPPAGACSFSQWFSKSAAGLKPRCLDPNPRDSNGIGLSATGATRRIEAPQVVLMCSQDWDPLLYISPTLLHSRTYPTALGWLFLFVLLIALWDPAMAVSRSPGDFFVVSKLERDSWTSLINEIWSVARALETICLLAN